MSARPHVDESIRRRLHEGTTPWGPFQGVPMKILTFGIPVAPSLTRHLEPPHGLTDKTRIVRHPTAEQDSSPHREPPRRSGYGDCPAHPPWWKPPTIDIPPARSSLRTADLLYRCERGRECHTKR